MKKILVFSAFALFLAACSNVATFKPMIEELASKWDGTTAAVTEFATNVKSEQSGWMNSINEMQIAPEAMTKWDEASKTKYNDIQASTENATTNLASISTELDAFIATWQEKGNEVQALKDGLSAGKLEGDVQAKIADLTNVANEATNKIAEWTTKFTEVKAAAAQAKQMFTEFTGTLPGTAKPATGTK